MARPDTDMWTELFQQHLHSTSNLLGIKNALRAVVQRAATQQRKACAAALKVSTCGCQQKILSTPLITERSTE